MEEIQKEVEEKKRRRDVLRAELNTSTMKVRELNQEIEKERAAAAIDLQRANAHYKNVCSSLFFF